MEGAALFIGVFGFLAVGAWIKAKREMAEKDRMFQAQKAILDKLGSGAEVTRFLESEPGKDFFERLKTDEAPAQPPQHAANQTAHGLIIGGLVVFPVGLGLVVASELTQEVELYIPAAICVFVAGGMLIAAVATRYLSKRWNLD